MAPYTPNRPLEVWNNSSTIVSDNADAQRKQREARPSISSDPPPSFPIVNGAVELSMDAGMLVVLVVHTPFT